MIGLFGGTFDPIHNGHLQVVVEVCARMNLDEIVIVPAGNPYMKGKGLTVPEKRLRMVELAVKDLPDLSISDMEIKRPGPSYTADSFKELQLLRPNEEIIVIMGIDAVLTVPRWDDPEYFMDLCKIVAITRPNHQNAEISILFELYKNADISILSVETPDISSTEIRRLIAEGKEFRHMVPEEVAEYITDNRLYVQEAK